MTATSIRYVLRYKDGGFVRMEDSEPTRSDLEGATRWISSELANKAAEVFSNMFQVVTLTVTTKES